VLVEVYKKKRERKKRDEKKPCPTLPPPQFYTHRCDGLCGHEMNIFRIEYEQKEEIKKTIDIGHGQTPPLFSSSV